MSDKEMNFDLLDGTIDDLADLKAFEPLPKGSYLLAIKWSRKDINDMPALILDMSVIEVLELVDNSKEPPATGATTNIAFILKKKDGGRNEVSEGQLKEIVKVLAPVVGGATIGEIITNSEGAQIVATIGIRTSKDDPDKKYNIIKSCAMPE